MIISTHEAVNSTGRTNDQSYNKNTSRNCETYTEGKYKGAQKKCTVSSAVSREADISGAHKRYIFYREQEEQHVEAK